MTNFEAAIEIIEQEIFDLCDNLTKKNTLLKEMKSAHKEWAGKEEDKRMKREKYLLGRAFAQYSLEGKILGPLVEACYKEVTNTAPAKWDGQYCGLKQPTSPPVKVGDYWCAPPNKIEVEATYWGNPVSTSNLTLGSLQGQINQQEKKDTTMYTLHNTAALEVQQRDRLIQRIEGAWYEKKMELKKAYGLENDQFPRTAEELVKRITEGKFSIVKDKSNGCFDDEDEIFYGGPLDRITWRDPAIKKDYDGYVVAKKAMLAAKVAALDEIYVKSLEEGLKVLREFEATKFT